MAPDSKTTNSKTTNSPKTSAPETNPPEEARPAPRHAPPGGGIVGLIMSLAGGSGHVAPGTAPAAEAAAPAPVPITADAFRGLVDAADRAKQDKGAEATAAAALERRRQIKAMLQQHIDDEMWQTLIAHAEAAASAGLKQFQLLRFPSGLCSDGGRKIDVNEPDWGETLRGEAAEYYARWERELKPAGFHLSAQILNWPGGMRGDIGLFLTWA
jgi:hypothetical protein